MMLEGTLKEHCLTIQQQAEERMDVLIKQMSQEQGVDEKLKVSDCFYGFWWLFPVFDSVLMKKVPQAAS